MAWSYRRTRRYYNKYRKYRNKYRKYRYKYRKGFKSGFRYGGTYGSEFRGTMKDFAVEAKQTMVFDKSTDADANKCPYQLFAINAADVMFGAF